MIPETSRRTSGSPASPFRGAQTLKNLDYAPFPEIARAIPEFNEARLRTVVDEAERAAADSGVPLAASLLVGAIGFEPTTPTVSR
jgi:hypothetical protein